MTLFHSPPLYPAIALLAGIGPLQGALPLLPVISKVQVLYSLVGHYNHIPSRVNFYNTNGSPPGNTYYVVPHLVFEPLVTLYNPYNTPLTLTRSRVMISNPPVGFRFKKNGDYLRDAWAAGQYSGLAQLQLANENDAQATKTLTMVLGGGNSSAFSGQIVLQPGESRTFSIRIEQNWNWGLETANAFSPRGFLDLDPSSDFTNKDHRTNTLFGIECIAGMDFRAGFQTDHLSVSSFRPTATKYAFETSAGPWVAIKTTDTVSVEAKGINTMAANSLAPHFQLSLLRGTNTPPAADTAKTFNFNISNLIQPAADGPAGSTLWLTCNVQDILQQPADPSWGGKKTIGVFTIVAKSEALQRGKFLAKTQPASHDLYETRVDRVYSFYSGWAGMGPSDAPLEGVAMTGMERSGNLFIIDVATQPLANLRVRGTSNPTDGFPDDLNGVSTIMEGPENSGIYKVTVDVAGRGERYFVRIER